MIRCAAIAVMAAVATMMVMVDFAIIGGGIIGSAVARELARRQAGRVIVLEKEPALGRHSSGRNSGVIHSGINQKPGSLKARMCVEGSRRAREFCRRRGVPLRECGTLVVARGEQERRLLERLLEMGNACGVPDLQILTSGQMADREPEARGVAALLSPTGAVVDSVKFLEAVADEARELGVEYRLGTFVHRAEKGRLWTVEGPLDAGHIVNCAGLHADRIARMMGVRPDLRIIPFRGEYMEVSGLGVRSMIYEAPDLRFPFLGIHLTRGTDGRLLAGPSAVLSFGREAYEKQFPVQEAVEMLSWRQFWRMAASAAFLGLAWRNARTSLSRRAFEAEMLTLIKAPGPVRLKPARAGIRAQLVDSSGRLVDDLVLERADRSTHVLNAVSPGMTASLAFADYVADAALGSAPPKAV